MYVVSFQDPKGLLARMARQIADHNARDLIDIETSSGDAVVPASTLLVFGNAEDRDQCVRSLDTFQINFTQDWKLD